MCRSVKARLGRFGFVLLSLHCSSVQKFWDSVLGANEMEDRRLESTMMQDEKTPGVPLTAQGCHVVVELQTTRSINIGGLEALVALTESAFPASCESEPSHPVSVCFQSAYERLGSEPTPEFRQRGTWLCLCSGGLLVGSPNSQEGARGAIPTHPLLVKRRCGWPHVRAAWRYGALVSVQGSIRMPVHHRRGGTPPPRDPPPPHQSDLRGKKRNHLEERLSDQARCRCHTTPFWGVVRVAYPKA